MEVVTRGVQDWMCTRRRSSPRCGCRVFGTMTPIWSRWFLSTKGERGTPPVPITRGQHPAETYRQDLLTRVVSRRRGNCSADGALRGNAAKCEWRASCSSDGVDIDNDKLHALRESIIGAAIEVHRATGPGLLESVYLRCLMIELRERNLRWEADRKVPLVYRGVPIDSQYRLDILVERQVIVELKAVEKLLPVHRAQVLTYLKLMNVPAGLLINFNVPLLKDGIRRVEHPDVYRARRAAGSPPIDSPEDRSDAAL